MILHCAECLSYYQVIIKEFMTREDRRCGLMSEWELM